MSQNPVSSGSLKIRVESVDFNCRLNFVVTHETDSSRSVLVHSGFNEIGDDVIREPTGYLDRASAQELADDLYSCGFKPKYATAKERELQEQIDFLKKLLEKVAR